MTKNIHEHKGAEHRVGEAIDLPLEDIRLADLDEEALRNIIHNFSVYREELEAQKEELDQALTTIEEQNSKLGRIFEMSPTGHVVLDSNHKILKSNFAAREILNIPHTIPYLQAFVPHFARFLKHSGALALFISWIERKNESSASLELQISDDPNKWVTLRKIEVAAHETLIAIADITREKNEQNQLIRVAHTDALTGLPNRILMHDRLLQAMLQADRNEYRVAVVFIDLDGFKAINDGYSHETGDAILKHVSHQLSEALRDTDTLARIGGDEFVAIMPMSHDGSEDIPVELFDRMIHAASVPLLVDDNDLSVSASMGITFYPQTEAVDASQLIRQADHAMYESKIAGKNRYVIYDDATQKTLSDAIAHEEEISMALRGHEMRLYYQPKIDLKSGRVKGFEALIRWRHPTLGIKLPPEFIPLAKNTDLMAEIDYWVMEQALSQLADWNREWIHQVVSINLSPNSLRNQSFRTRFLSTLLNHSDVDINQLQVEILETEELTDMASGIKLLLELDELGIHFSLDDFGTGRSSLSRLQHLPIRELKIDQSFIGDMLSDEKDLEIVKAIIHLGKIFGLETVAEGVETSEQLHLLKELGCDTVQGFLISHALPAEKVQPWYNNWTSQATLLFDTEESQDSPA